MYNAVHAHEDNDSVSFNALHVGLMLGKNSADEILKYVSYFCFRKYALTFHANCLLKRQFA